MKVLGIETSCDETAVCLIEAEGEFGSDLKYSILGNALISQATLHAEYGGVFPNLAKREHAKNLVPILDRALNLAEIPRTVLGSSEKTALEEILQREPELLLQIIPYLETHTKPDINAIAVTAGPGLEPALWVGINFAKALSLVWNVPIIAINHMEGHIVLSMMETSQELHSNVLQNIGTSGVLAEFEFPMLALLISGGHTELVLSKEFGRYELIGQTRDDAAGEAFDKVARMLELPYPGGPEISRLAKEAREENIKSDFELSRPMLHENTYDFSFSGLKTAVRRIIETKGLGDELKLQVAREFEDAVAEVLVAKTIRAADEYGANTVVVGGGVSANTYIRLRLVEALAKPENVKLLIPPPELATDNAIMIALSGYFHALKKDFADPAVLAANGNLKLA